MSNARANLFPKISDRIAEHFAFYRCIISETCNCNLKSGQVIGFSAHEIVISV